MFRCLCYTLFLLGAIVGLDAASQAQHMNSAEAPCRKVVAPVDLSQCFNRTYKVADRKLNLNYQKIYSALQPVDQQKLLAAQNLWLKFRDATCAAEKSLYGQGTGAYPAYLACLEETTRKRTEELQTIYGWVIEKFAPGSSRR